MSKTELRRRKLPHSIPSRSLRRITFVLTNGKRLTEAWEINDLFLGPREHDLLWRALKEARLQAERHYIIHEENAVYRVDFAVICREGTLGVICGEPPRVARPHLLYFTPAEIGAAPQKCVEVILDAAAQLGEHAQKKSVAFRSTLHALRPPSLHRRQPLRRQRIQLLRIHPDG